MAGRPMVSRAASPSSTEVTVVAGSTGSPASSMACRNSSRSSASRIDSHRGAEQLDAEPFEHARLLELDREVEGGLAAEGGDQRVGPLAFEDRGDRLQGQWLDIAAVGETGVGHDRRRVGVHQHDPAALLAQRLDPLDTRVVELAGLTDPDRPGAEDADRLGDRRARLMTRSPGNVRRIA